MAVIVNNAASGCEIKGDVPSLGCLSQVVTNIIYYLFAFLSAVALLFLLYGAIKFVVSRGDQKALQSARGTMTYAVIGLVLILLSYSIILLITNALGLPNILQNFTFYQQ
ncbi:hypothetical protein HY440_01355 [Candidatus Microgenomates bacterium]|nr:hypothetical protein [Candidatus Microgenomates bacterium]